MEITQYGEFKTGRLLPITIRGKTDHSFVPNPLPPSAVGNDPFWPLLLEARIRLERLSTIGSQLPDVRLLLRPLQRREALTSNSLEGTFVAPQELLLFEARELGASKEGGRRDDWREVLAYDGTLRTACGWIDGGEEIDNQMIQKLHLLLLNVSARGKQKDPGHFRRSQVIVGVDRRYIPAPPDHLPPVLSNFETYLASQPSDVDPLIAAYVAHYQFEAIHPFEDGNGRIGRLLLALCIYKWLNLATPCLYMSEFFEKHRKDYISHLFRISTHGEWADWIEFCLKGTIEQAEASISRCEALQVLKRTYQQALGARAPRAQLLLDDLFTSPFITVTDAARKLDVSYRSALSDLRALEQAHIVTQMKNQYPRTYAAYEIFTVAYGD